MTLVVPHLPAHIALPTLPTPQQLNIPYASDPATPRAALAHAAIDIVAAAVTLAPALTPALPTENSEYCLSPKRKAIDDDPLDVPRIAKRARADDSAVFGTVTHPSLPEVSSNDADQASFEQALAAILSCSAPAQDVGDPSPSPAPEPAPSHASSSRVAHSPLATSTVSFSDSVEASSFTAGSVPRMTSPPRNRVVEPSLWKMACRTRVDQVISMHGGQAIRETVAQESRLRLSTMRHVSGASVTRRSLPVIVDPSQSELELEIYTPVTYPQSPELSDKEDASISDAESDIDMSFDLDDDSDTDSDTEEGADFDALSAHESILDVPVSESDTEYNGGNGTSSGTDGWGQPETTTLLLTPITLPSPIAIPLAPPIWPPRLPCLSSIPAYCLREYPQLQRRGTPAQNSVFARGSLLLRCCRFGASRSSNRTSLVL